MHIPSELLEKYPYMKYIKKNENSVLCMWQHDLTVTEIQPHMMTKIQKQFILSTATHYSSISVIPIGNGFIANSFIAIRFTWERKGQQGSFDST